MGLFSKVQMEQIKQAAVHSNIKPKSVSNSSIKNIQDRLQSIEQTVLEYFADSDAILITNVQQLHDYVTKVISSGYAGIDTETTGLDRIHDTIVGASLYYPGGTKCYIPSNHIVPIFEEPYKNQLSYQQLQSEFQRIADSHVKLVFANADFDLAMIYKDIGVDFNDCCYYDVLIAARCLKEDEPHANLKALYAKYVLKDETLAKRFSDFFPPELFPYCKPEVAKLYAANDAEITFKLMQWQMQYLDKSNPKCKQSKLESISDLIWNVEFPLIKVCQNMHRNGIYLDSDIATALDLKYSVQQQSALQVLHTMVQDILDAHKSLVINSPFKCGAEFNPNSPKHVQYLLYTLLSIPVADSKAGTGEAVLKALNLPVTEQILKVRSLNVLINTFVSKLPKEVTSDSRIHAQFKQIGAATGRLSCANPNLMNIPSKAKDIRHLFRATPASEITVDCDCNNDTVTASLNRWDFVYTNIGKKAVKDLVVGDIVKLEHDKEVVYREVRNLEDSSADIGIRNVIF